MIGNLKYFSNRYCAHIRKLQTNLFQHEYKSCQMSTATQAVKKVEKQRERKLDKDSKESKSFVTNMFVGRTVTEQLLPFPNYLSMEQLETLQMLVDPSEKFFSECNDAAANDEQETIIESTLEGLKELGCFGLQIPAEYGGIGLNNTQYARLVEICGSHDLGIGVTLGAHQSIGLKGILICGTEEQKKKYLPRLATGEHCAAFALTEPSSGSDAMSIRSRAVPSADGSHYILNGSKIWITNGGFAEIFTVFAQTPVKSEKTGEMEEKITAFIVERGFGGLSNSSPEKKMGIKASKSVEVYFDNVKIPAENVLGEVGKGFKVAMEILNNGRFGMAAAMTGTIRHAVQKATDFASNRTQFGKKIQEFEMIQEKIARMTMYHYISESLAYMISGNMDNKSKDYHLEAAISKVFASEAAWHSTDEAIQILGGMGYMKDSGLERVMRDLRIFRIFEGTNDILRLFVALTGLQYAGGHLKELQKAMKNPASNVGLIIGEGTKRARKAAGFLKPKIEGVHPNLEPAASFVAECVELFGSTSESLLIKHGKNIIEQQFVLNRIADSAIDIYTSAVVISRASKALKEGLPSAEHEKKMALVWVSEASARVAKNLTSTKSGRKSEDFSAMQDISREVCENGGVVALRPLGI